MTSKPPVIQTDSDHQTANTAYPGKKGEKMPFPPEIPSPDRKDPRGCHTHLCILKNDTPLPGAESHPGQTISSQQHPTIASSVAASMALKKRILESMTDSQRTRLAISLAPGPYSPIAVALSRGRSGIRAIPFAVACMLLRMWTKTPYATPKKRRVHAPI